MQLNILFEATILANGVHKNNYRSGIYVVTYNLFRELIKYKNLNIGLFCNCEKYNDLKLFLKEYFPDYTFEIITDEPNNFINNSYTYLRSLREKYKEQGNNLKYILQIIVAPLSPLAKLLKSIYLKNIKYDKYNIFFSPSVVIPKFFDSKKIKKVTYLHDTIPLLFPEITAGANGKRGWFRELTNEFNKENYYFTNSKSTRNDFINNYTALDANKVKTALLACDEKFKPISEEKITEAKKKYNIPLDKKYIFSLCTLEPRKNLERTVKTFIDFIKKHNIEDLIFVLGGGHWDSFINILENNIEDLGKYKDKIVKAGYIDDEDLPALYSGAEWFVYTSRYEGFGLPPLEAMSCGCPVITSNNSSLPEVVEDTGIMIDWDSDSQHIEAYEKYYFDENLRIENSKKGLERAKTFSWEKCANQIVEAFLKPEVSIVIPVYNNFDLTKNCIDSILNANIKTPYEIIIADDGSTDETINIEKYYENVHLVKTPNNMGFLLNVKNAIQHTHGNYILLMNNDMIAKPKFLDYLYKTIKTEKNIGIAGAVMLNKDNSIQEAGATVYCEGVTKWNHQDKSLKSLNRSKLYDVDYCSGCGIMFSKEDWNAIGGFDEYFVPAYYEDVDLCYQLKYKLNKRIVCQPKAQIYHLCGKTYSDKAKNLSGENRLKFLNKWEYKLRKHKHFYQYIFSIVGSRSRNLKLITFLGIQIPIKFK